MDPEDNVDRYMLSRASGEEPGPPAVGQELVVRIPVPCRYTPAAFVPFATLPTVGQLAVHVPIEIGFGTRRGYTEQVSPQKRLARAILMPLSFFSILLLINHRGLPPCDFKRSLTRGASSIYLKIGGSNQTALKSLASQVAQKEPTKLLRVELTSCNLSGSSLKEATQCSTRVWLSRPRHALVTAFTGARRRGVFSRLCERRVTLPQYRLRGQNWPNPGNSPLLTCFFPSVLPLKLRRITHSPRSQCSSVDLRNELGV